MLKLVTFLPTTFLKILFKNLYIGLAIVLIVVSYFGYQFYQSNNQLKLELANTQSLDKSNKDKLASISAELDTLKSQDQIKRNDDLQVEIKNIHDSYQKAVKSYEDLQDLKVSGKKAYDSLDKDFANALNQLSDKKFDDANKTLASLDKNIQTETTKLAPPPPPPAPAGPPAVANNNPPGSGYSRQSVTSDAGTFTVDIITGDLNSTKVIIDTASDSDCRDNCPVLSLSDYVSRSGAYAGVNGSYFCPASYPTCAGKTNSFDTLLMNKNKHYFNSDNNVYSTVPAAIFSPGSARFVGQSLEWGRDTGVDSVIANQPLLLAGGNVVFGGGSDPKQGSKGARSFIGAGGGKVYIGVVQNATVAEVARVLKAMGMSEALNLDSGGSTALWAGGYKVGPGRQIPNAVLFVNR